MFILPEVKDLCPMRQQMEMAWRQLKFGDNKREPRDRFIPVCTPSYMEWVAEQYALKPAYGKEKASVDLGSLHEEAEQWKSKVEILEIKLRMTEEALNQSQEAEDKVKKSNRQLRNECRELHDDTRRMFNRYSVEPMASKAQRFEEHLREVLEFLERMMK
ncbi:hypothetical protein ACH5RR_018572 [Cinchona calisaya]|uniref:Uncharacterized protein n=1 Tax=Cinchona calisaya TaxID=153742 RepID=A0ABD2ZMB7_9GENT